MRYPISLAALLLAAGCNEPAAPGALMTVVTEIHVAPDSARLHIGDTVRFTATPKNGAATLANVLVQWGSSNPAVMTVSSTGLVTAVGLGQAEVSARVGDLVRSRPVRVWVPTSKELLIPDGLDLLPGWTAPLPVTIVDVYGETYPVTDSIGFHVEDSTVVTVWPTGWVLGLRPGMTRVTVTVGSMVAATDVLVRAMPLGLTVAWRSPFGPPRHRLEAWRLDGTEGPASVFEINDVESLTLERMLSGLDWSADGRRFLHSCQVDRICIREPDGSLRVLTVSGGAFAPAWQPDGSVIYSDIDGQLRSLHPDEPGKQLPIPGVSGAAWLPRRASTGGLVFACRVEDPFYVWVESAICRLVQGTQELVEDCGSHPDWSPDGARVAWVCGHVFTWTLSTGSQTMFRIPSVAAHAVRWSPDGSLLAVLGQGQLWLVRPDGSHPITRHAACCFTAVAWQALDR